MSPSPASGGEPPTLLLEVRLSDGRTHDLELGAEEGELGIGRATENRLQLPDESLSRRHARIYADDGRWLFEDLGSRNGSFVNALEVHRPVALRPGDRIRLGGSELIVKSHGGAPTSSSGSLSEATAIFDVSGLQGVSQAEGLFDDVRKENRALALLSRAGSLLISHGELDETFAQVLDLALEAFEAEHAAVALLPAEGEGPPELAATRSSVPGTELQLSSTVAAAVVEERKAVVVVDVAADPRLQSAQSVQIQGVSSLMCAPLWNGSRVSGLLYVDRRLGRGDYGEDDLKVLSLLANILAVKIENERLLQEAMDKQRLEEELAVARRIQQRLLPSEARDLPHLEIDGICRACAEVGGDFFDHFRLPNGHVGVIVADVCGKGVGGSLLAATLQAAIRGGIRVEASPAERLAWLNAFLHEHSPVDKYVTAAWVEVDEEGGTVTSSCAGHPAVLLLKAGGGVERLGEGGLPLGLFPEADYGESRAAFEPGDRILLYTDGVAEAAPAGAREPQFGEERMIEAMRAVTGGPREACEAIFRNLAVFTEDADLMDDATLVVARRR